MTPLDQVRRHHGFTLLELVLVLMVLALVLAAAAPSLAGWNRGQRLQNAASSLLSASRWARSQAIVSAMPHQLEVNADAGTYRVSRLNGQQWEPVPGEFGRDIALPEGLSIDMRREDETVLPAIDFHPNGRVSPATIELSAEWGEVITIGSTGAAQSLRILTPTGGP